MKIKFPQLIYFLDFNRQHLLLRFRLLPLNQSLFLEYNVHQLTYQESNINLKNSFYNNPTDEGLYNRTNKILLGDSLLGFNEILAFKGYIDSITDRTLTLFLREKKIAFLLEDFQLMGIRFLVNDLCNNYTGYQISLIEIITKYKNEIAEEITEVIPAKITVMEPELMQDAASEAEIFVQTANPPLDTNIIQDILQLAPNNLTIFYLSKYIFNNLKLDKQNNTILIPNFLYYSYQFKLDLFTIVTSINYEPGEIKARLNSLYSILYNLVVDDSDNFNVNSQNVFLILFLIYIYSLNNNPSAQIKVRNLDIDIKDTFKLYLNYILNALAKDNNKSIKIKLENIPLEPVNSINYKDILEPHIKKFKYLVNIDKKLFIERVIGSAASSSGVRSSSSGVRSSSKPLLVVPPYVVELSKLTDEYLILQEVASGKLIQNPPLIIQKHFNTIINKIFPSLDSNKHFFIDLEPVSTQILLYNYVVPNLIDESNLVSLEIMFKFVMPYLFDKYGLKRFTNYFF